MFEEWLGNTQSFPERQRFAGRVETGIVRENDNQEQKGMVKVEYCLGEDGQMVSRWIPIMTVYAAPSGGMYFLPEVGTMVVLAFLGGSLDHPVVLGSLWSKSVPFPDAASKEKNTEKLIRTKGGTEIVVSDEEGKEGISITTPGGLAVVLNDEKKSISLKDKDAKNSVILDGDKGEVKVCADKKIVLSIGGTAAVTIESNKVEIKSGSISAEGSQKLALKGQSASLQGSQVQVKADASMKAESSGIMELKASLLKAN